MLVDKSAQYHPKWSLSFSTIVNMAKVTNVMNKVPVTYYLGEIPSKINFLHNDVKLNLIVMLWLRIDYHNADVGGEFSDLAVERSILDYNDVKL